MEVISCSHKQYVRKDPEITSNGRLPVELERTAVSYCAFPCFSLEFFRRNCWGTHKVLRVREIKHEPLEAGIFRPGEDLVRDRLRRQHCRNTSKQSLCQRRDPGESITSNETQTEVTAVAVAVDVPDQLLNTGQPDRRAERGETT